MIYGNNNLSTYYPALFADIMPSDYATTEVGGLYKNQKSCTVIKPRGDTKDVTNMSYMFENCTNLVTVTYFNTSNVTDMSYMFYGCNSLITIPQLDTSKVTNMASMFYSCNSLITIPQLDTSKVTNMASMFSGCQNLITIPQLDTSKVTDMSNMFNGCKQLSDLPEFDCSKCTTLSSFFGYSSLSYLTRLGGFKNYGMQNNAVNLTSVLNYAQYIDKESAMNVINGLYDRATAGYKVLSIKFHANTLKMLSEDDIAIATNKGWTVS